MSKRVLLIEPDKILAATYEAALKKAGFTVAQAKNAQEAIFEVDKQKPEVIILELQLAEHNGVEFLYELRSYPEWQGIPVIILSQISSNEAAIDKKVAQQLGVVSYGYKPHTNLKKLIGLVEQIVAS